MKTFTSSLTLAGIIAGVVVPGFIAAGVSIQGGFAVAVGFGVATILCHALFKPDASIDQVRTGSPVATNYKAVQPPPVAMLPRRRRRVRAIIEAAA